MRIASFQITNYKSFRSTEEVELKPGFNVIVGQNNAGKTALVEALSLQYPNNAHRSQKTVPYSGATLSTPHSEIRIAFVLDKDEFINLLKDLQVFYVPIGASTDENVQAVEFLNTLPSEQTVIKTVFRLGQGFTSAYSEAYGERPHSNNWMLRFRINRDDATPSREGRSVGDPNESFAIQIAKILSQRIYFFRAERLNLGEAEIRAESRLSPEAANLPQVLNYLQTKNPSRFSKFNQLVSAVFPEIRQITAPPRQDRLPPHARILIWTIDPGSEREDLAMSLLESGTGIGQVLAILYVVVTSDYPRTIIIDEPQSFLHPGAIRKLFALLQQEYGQHQYIVATHSPTVVTSANPETLVMVRKREAESAIEVINMKETHRLRNFLAEIGARLSDVFGADNILWVEGGTEEQCFPLILAKIAQQPLLGTAILGVTHTGDFERRRAKMTVTVMSSINGFREGAVTAEEIEKWVENNQWETKYLGTTISAQERTDTIWVRKVHGARVLEDLFDEFSGNGVSYDKVEHGVLLTTWLIENSPDYLMEIADRGITQRCGNKGQAVYLLG